GFSQSDDFHAELISAGGGFDLGAAIGGSEDSVLTIGIVLGAGANVLSLSSTFADDSEDSDDVTTCGIVPAPTYRELVHVNGFVQPYVSMSAQLLPWMGFEFRLGYIFPVVGMDVGDLIGIPAPSLEMSGPTVSFGFVFGGIGPSEEERQARLEARATEIDPEDAEEHDKKMVTIASEGSFIVAAGDEIVIENGMGDLMISAYPVDSTDATGDLVVQWQALRTAKEKRIEELQIIVEDADSGATLHTTGMGRIDYAIQIPTGIDLKVKNGAGNVTIVGHEAQTIIVESGIGEMDLQSLQAAALIVAGGLGRIELTDIAAQMLLVDLGLGEILIDLPVDTSARLLAKGRRARISRKDRQRHFGPW
ncbi:MAG: hypothetical protein JRE40_16390, partial [Deltaproteobacteria bacterium]|nr:hypothetical protein [Deltaproteobacteria bacterium]